MLALLELAETEAEVWEELVLPPATAALVVPNPVVGADVRELTEMGSASIPFSKSDAHIVGVTMAVVPDVLDDTVDVVLIASSMAKLPVVVYTSLMSAMLTNCILYPSL